METRGGGDAATPGARRRRGQRGATHARAAGGATDPVAAHVRPRGSGGAAERHWSRRRGGAAVPRRARPPAHLRVSVRGLRQLRGADGQPASHRSVRRRRPYGWVVRPLIFL